MVAPLYPNFLALLSLMAESDINLQEHLMTAGKNAKYTSKTVQNELISIIGQSIRATFIKNMEFFSIIADELTEQISNKEILSVCLRFVQWEGAIPSIHEIFFDFVHLVRTTGEAISTAILKSLHEHGVDVTKMRGQAYDGAAAMSSSRVGVQAKIKEHAPLAVYTHCNSHVKSKYCCKFFTYLYQEHDRCHQLNIPVLQQLPQKAAVFGASFHCM